MTQKLASAHSVRLGLRLIALAWLLCVGHAAQAFNSDEHQKTSALAFDLTQAYLKERTQGVALVSEPAWMALASLKANDYGFIVQCVDYMLYPERIFTYGWLPATSTGSGAEAATSPISMPGMPASGDDVVLPSGLRNRCDKEGTTVWIQAAHNNYAHFQQDLFISLRLWHLLAVQLGKEEGNYVAALVTNAVADHYLQDLFAPGHIVTPRDKLTDLPATSTHDLANRMGVVFEPRLSPELRALLGFLCGAPAGDSAATIACDDRRPVPMRLASEAKIAHLVFHTQALLADKKTLFRGDGHLEEPDQSRQHLLMLAVQMRSILDVLQGQNHLKTLGFKFELGEGTAAAWTDFGNYIVTKDMPDFAKVADLAAPPADDAPAGAANSTPVNPIPTAHGLRFVCSLGGCDDKPYILKTRSPILSLSNQRESQSSGAYSARNLYTVELSTFHTAWDASGLTRDWAGIVEVAPLVLGWANYQQGHSRGNGPTYRAAVAIPETDVSVGPYVRWLSYAPSGGQVRKLSYGLRVDSGFFGYFGFYVTGGMDYGLSNSGELQRGRVWAGGLRFGLPLTRLGDIADTLLGTKAGK